MVPFAVTPGWCLGGIGDAVGAEDGMINFPRVMTTDGTHLYVMDKSNHRISRWNASTGVFEGWIGGQAQSTQGFTTTVTAVPANGNGSGIFNEHIGIVADETYFYVADNVNHRIAKITKSTGEYMGWMGRIASPATGGDPSCSVAPLGQATPGFCIGGLSMSGVGNGMFTSPHSLILDGNQLYVAEFTNSRLIRITAK